MKRVKWPSPVGELNVLMVLENSVFNQPFFREPGRPRLAVCIIEKLEQKEVPDLTDAEAETLEKGMLQAGQQTSPAAFTRFYLRLLAAVQEAESV